MLSHIYIDHNVWDFLYERNIDLAKELPSENFALHLTREAVFEISPTPDSKRSYIEKTILRCNIDVKPYFGFYDDQHSLSEQRMGGLGFGYLASEEEAIFIQSQKPKLSVSKKPKTGLFKNEADIALAARSFHSIVLTLDKKPGPLKNALSQGGKVVFLGEIDTSILSLQEFIFSAIQA